MSGMRKFSLTEIQQIKTTLTNPRDYCLFVLGYRTGFRITELLSLTIDSVWSGSKVRDSLKVWRQDVKGRTTSREVMLHPEAKEAICKWLLQVRLDDRKSPLFASRVGNKAITRFMAHKIYKNLVVKLGLEGSVATHSARKTFAHDMYRKLGRDLVATKAAMGHSSIVTTEIYLTPDQDVINKAILED